VAAGDDASCTKRRVDPPTSVAGKPYISNRSISNDVSGDGWGISFYDYFRYRYIKVNSNSGPYPEFLKAENDLLAAEGYIRTGNINAARPRSISRGSATAACRNFRVLSPPPRKRCRAARRAFPKYLPGPAQSRVATSWKP
jgi:hypothetical protein